MVDRGRSALTLTASAVLGAVLGAGLTFGVTAYRAMLHGTPPDPARVSAYRSFLESASRVDASYVRLRACLLGKGHATARLCAGARDAAGGDTAELRRRLEAVSAYGSADAVAFALTMTGLVTSVGERLDLDRFRAAQASFALVMCRDVSPHPGQECAD